MLNFSQHIITLGPQARQRLQLDDRQTRRAPLKVRVTVGESRFKVSLVATNGVFYQKNQLFFSDPRNPPPAHCSPCLPQPCPLTLPPTSPFALVQVPMPLAIVSFPLGARYIGIDHVKRFKSHYNSNEYISCILHVSSHSYCTPHAH